MEQSTKQTFRMSECGHCPRQLTYKYLNYPAAELPVWLETSAREGKLHEGWLLDQLRADDIAVYGEQDYLSIDNSLFLLEGHIDGYENDHGIERIVECKTMSQGEYQRWSTQGLEAFPQYAAQITAYMTASGLPCRLIVKNRNTGTTHGLDSRDTAYFFSTTPMVMADILHTLSLVAQAIQAGKLYEGVQFDPDSLECKRCRYAMLCTPPPPILAEDQEAELRKAVGEYRLAKATADSAAEVIDRARNVLRQYAETSPSHSLLFDDIVAKVYPVRFVSYPKAEVEALLDKETLQRIAKVTERMDLRITDKRSAADD